MRAFPAPDPRYGEVLTARQVPRAQWRNYHTWVQFYLHCCQKYRHHPADSQSLPLFPGKLASNGQTAAQRAQAQCAVDYYSVFLAPEVRAFPDDDAVAPTAPNDGADGLAAGSRIVSSVKLACERNTRMSPCRPLAREKRRTRHGER